MARKGLGRGIEALIPGNDLVPGSPIVEMDPAEIEADPLQPARFR